MAKCMIDYLSVFIPSWGEHTASKGMILLRYKMKRRNIKSFKIIRLHSKPNCLSTEANEKIHILDFIRFNLVFRD